MTETSATRTETNREIIRRTFDRWQQGIHPDPVFAPAMTWRIVGHSVMSKEYPSKQAFIDEVLAPFGERFSESEPFRPTDGLVVDGTAFFDSISFNDLWSRVQP